MSGTYQCIKTSIWADMGMYNAVLNSPAGQVPKAIAGAVLGLAAYTIGNAAEQIVKGSSGTIKTGKWSVSFGNPLGDGGANSVCAGGDYMCVVAYSVNLNAEPLDYIWVENIVKVYKNGQLVGVSSAMGVPCLWMCGPKIGPFPAAKGDEIKAELWQVTGCCWTLIAQVLIYSPAGPQNMSTYKGSPGGFTVRETYGRACSPPGPRKVWEGTVVLP
ncbi:MAG: hypothetical protein HYU64_12000 [Armatimonadetes bacterium]|nr:hypothetical protein [Armatimonadota bacterium]